MARNADEFFAEAKITDGKIRIPSKVQKMLNLENGDKIVFMIRHKELIFKKGMIVPVD